MKLFLIELAQESVDKITKDNLKEYKKLLQKQLQQHKKNLIVLHEDDVKEFPILISALNLIIKQFEN